MDKIKILYNEEEIAARVKELAETLYQKYGDDEVVFVCTLKGAVFFACDLLKRYKGDARLEFLRVASYEGESSTGKISLKMPLDAEKINGKHAVIIEDIVDTGYTLEYIRKYVADMHPASLIECTLLDKKARRVVDINPTYSGFVIDDLFVVGYGLDYDQKYRNLPYIGVVVKEWKINM